VVTATVAGDVIYDESNEIAINSNASIKLANTGAISYVGGTSVFSPLGLGTLTLNGLQSGDFVLFFSASDGQDQNTPNSGWTAIPGLTGQPDNDGAPDSAAFYKFSTGTSVSASGFASNSVYVMIAFRGVKTDIPFDVNATESSAFSGMPNPPSITPTSDQCMSVIVGFLDDDNVEFEPVIAPSGYTLAVVQGDSSSANCTVMTAYKNLEQAIPENPGAFESQTGNDSNKAITIALRQNVVGSTTSSSLRITVGGALAGRNSFFTGQHEAKNQTGVIDWQVIEYED